MAIKSDRAYRQEYMAILKTCSDFGFSDTEDVPLSAIVRSAFQTLRDSVAAPLAQDDLQQLVDLLKHPVVNRMYQPVVDAALARLNPVAQDDLQRQLDMVRQVVQEQAEKLRSLMADNDALVLRLHDEAES